MNSHIQLGRFETKTREMVASLQRNRLNRPDDTTMSNVKALLLLFDLQMVWTSVTNFGLNSIQSE